MADLQRTINQRVSERLALEGGAWPMRYALGAPAPMTLENRADAVEQMLRHGIIHASAGTHQGINSTIPTITKKKKEVTTMTKIERKNYTTPPVKTPAGSLAARHLRSLVTITLDSGAEITDVLVALSSGHVGSSHPDKVRVLLDNVNSDHYEGGFYLDTKSVVLVRRPKVVKKTAAKRG